MALERTSLMDIEEYFELEENNPDTRYEYLDGDIYMMSGGSANHATIGSNIHAILRGLLRGGPCRVYNSDMRVLVSERRYFHPDVTVTCDARDRGTTNPIHSPRLVVEVLSISTESRDRGRKLQCYLACPTIEQYLLVDARSMRIETYRKEWGKWMYDAFEADDEVELASLDIHFPIADAYEDVVFANEENDRHLSE
jgi:Uma2 family endonuclease